MSNYLAIATVTAALQRTLQASVQRDVEGVRISTVAPSRLGQGTPETGINLFLYHVVRNNALKNSDAAAVRSRGKPSAKRQAALELYYMLSFYGSDIDLEPQRLLGSVIHTLTDQTILSAALIQDTIADSTFAFLSGSDLADQIQQIQIMPVDMNLEDLSKVWSVFFQTSYLLSVAYKVMVVMIDGEDSAERALPVRDRGVASIAPFPSRPQVDRVIAQAGSLQPIVADSVLLIQGKQLQGAITQVRIGDVQTQAIEATEAQIILPLNRLEMRQLRPGVQSLQVIHPTTSLAGSSTSGVESNVVPFVLRPTVTSVQVSQIEVDDEEHRSATLEIEIDLTIGVQQRVVLSLYEWSIDHPTNYLFDAPVRRTDTSTLTLPVQRVKPGEYLVRLIIDGAESLLGIDSDPDSPTFNWYNTPRVTIA